MEGHDVVIVGAGIAGAATAWALARRGVRSVVLLEREETGDRHSTGRNAAILRTAIPDPVLHRLARESLAFHFDPPAGFGEQPLVHSSGLLLGASEGEAAALLAWTGRRDCAWRGDVLRPDEARRRMPLLGPRLAAAVLFPDEGTLDVHALHQGFLRGAMAAGHALRTRTGALELILQGGRVAGVRMDGEELWCGTVVLAGGAWADALATRAGLPLPLEPRRRHLVKTVRRAEVDPSWPVAWLHGPEFYLRPESGAALLCGCEQAAVAPDASERTDPVALEQVAERAALWVPALADARVETWWAGARTFAADGRFVVGLDPRLEGLAWAAALGGHGITTAPAVGALAAEWIATGASEHPSAAALAPVRLVAGAVDLVS